MFSRNLFSGASSKKDHRFDSKNQVKGIHFSKEVTPKLQIDNINSAAFSQWIESEISKLTNEDFVSELVMGFLNEQTIEAQEIGQQLKSMIGEEKAISFVEKLWPLLIDAQNNETGVPSVIIEEAQKKLAKRQLLAQRLHEEE